MAKSKSIPRELVNVVLNRSDIVQVAKSLGLELSAENTSNPRVLCAFHPDTRPSMTLYRDTGVSRRDNFYCFACGASGDAISLVKEIKGWDFPTSVAWLANLAGVSISLSGDRATLRTDRQFGLRVAEELFAAEQVDERTRLKNWAMTRKLSDSIVAAAGLRAPNADKLSSKAANDREKLDGLVEAGLLAPLSHAEPSTATQRPLFTTEFRDFFRRPRILFPIHDEAGELVGYAGRALGSEEPKYLYTKGLKRSAILYRMNAVRDRCITTSRKRRLNREQEFVHLYVVEGLIDALRLETFDLSAVAVLGSSLTSEQVDCIGRLASDIERTGRTLIVHLFFDSDDAGRRGVVQSLRKLIPVAVAKRFFLIDVISPSIELGQGAHDPDEFLRSVEGRDNVEAFLRSWAYSILDAMVATAWNIPPSDLNDRWDRRTYAQEVLVLRDVELQFQADDWLRIFERLRPNNTWFEKAAQDVSKPWSLAFENFIRPSAAFIDPLPQDTTEAVAPPETNEQIQRAIQLAYSSTQRRELPVDEGSWKRIRIAIDAFVPYFRACLKGGVRPLEPFVSIEVPKPDGTFRLKALPAPEELILQQYLLVELLRDYREGREFFESIPAVRYSRRYPSDTPITTAIAKHRPSKTVSFAYQVDMDVVEGILPPRREGIFRPYYQCWTEFIQFLDKATAEIDAPLLHVARLDIRRYYDVLPRTTVNDVLFPSLNDALRHLVFSEEHGARACAAAFCPEITEPEMRARRIIDWLCDQSFGYEYLNSQNGQTIRSATERGVPQGPDLSAYLANIALFPLDARVDEAATKRGIVYARYVDDIVLAAPSSNALREIRSVIDSELTRIGLELNDKSEQFDPMSKEAFRAWLTDRRGGLGVSGPFAGPPLIEPVLMDDPWALEEIPERDEALRLLYDTDNLAAPTSLVIDIVRRARRAIELRHNDLVKAAMLLWRCVGSEAVDCESVDVPARFVGLWNETKPASSNTSSEDDDRADAKSLFVWTDGLDLFLRAQPERFRELLRSDWESLHKAQDALAVLVCNRQFVEELGGHLHSSVTLFARHRHLVTLKVLQIAAAAAALPYSTCKPTVDSLGLSDADVTSPAVSRLLFSVAELAGRQELLDTAVMHTSRQTVRSSRLLFHEALARLQLNKSHADQSNTAPSVDPLSAVIDRVQQKLTELKARPNEPDSVLLSILSCWLPGEQTASVIADLNSELVECALDAFINVAKSSAPDLMHSRPSFAQRVLQVGSETVRLIPAPPGMRIPGLLGVVDEHIVRRRQLQGVDTPLVPKDLHWSAVGNNLDDLECPIIESDIGSWRLVVPFACDDVPAAQKPPETRLKQVQWLADAFPALTKIANGTEGCPATPLNLITKSLAAAPTDLLGYQIPPLSRRITGDENKVVRSSAFLLVGRCSLARIEVPQFYGPLWQVGTALSEVLGLSAFSRSIHSDMLTEEAGAPLSVEHIADKLLRVALYRLRGFWDPVSYVAQDSNGWPRTVSRVIEGLRSFPQLDAPEAQGAAICVFVRLFAEGKALELRFGKESRRFDDCKAGSAIEFLATFAQMFFTVDSQLARSLPAYEPVAEMRRSVSGWYSLSRRLRLLNESHSSLDKTDISIQALETGCSILALNQYARALVLELWSQIPSSSIAKALSGNWDDTLRWVDEDWQLFHGRYVDRLSDSELGDDNREMRGELPEQPVANDSGLGMPRNLQLTLRVIKRATSTASSRYWRDLQQVTPLGWFVLLDLTLRYWENDTFRASDCQSEQEGSGAVLDDLRNLCTSLATPLSEDARDRADAPWGEIDGAIRSCDAMFVDKAIRTLARIENRLGIKVVLQASNRLSMGQPRGESIEVRVNDGTRHLRASQISVSALRSERNRHGAEYYRTADSHDPVFVWTEARRGETLLGVHVVRPGLAAWAGFTYSDAGSLPRFQAKETNQKHVLEVSPIAGGESEKASEEAEEHSTHSVRSLSSANEATHNSLDEQSQRPSTGSQQQADIEPNNASEAGQKENRGDSCEASSSTSTSLSLLRELEQIQDDAWKRRRTRPDSHLRVALVQWDLDDTYRHPVVDACIPELNGKLPHLWSGDTFDKAGELQHSCNEHRRREILRAVLRACGRFDVDALLLPEYSVRSDTIGWIRRNIQTLAPGTWVWAGTFRRPPYSAGQSEYTRDLSRALGDVPNWSALHVIVDPRRNTEDEDETRRFLIRRKKYPAIGVNEMFSPNNEELRPLYTEGNDLRRKIIELICSEVFIVSSPANLHAAAYAYRELAAKFGVHLPHNSNWRDELKKIVNEHLTKDIVSFGKSTSVIASPFERRSVVFVPAMTSRSADYAILGQAGFLASGLTTVFCNAVDPPFGSGNSCFIGHDGWGKNDDEMPGKPGPGPYHGALPGIFRPFDPIDRGCLGKNEQAMVIADIDTQFSVEGKPRPQLLPAPLQLVGHLPIIETWSYGKAAASTSKLSECRCSRASVANWELVGKEGSNDRTNWLQDLLRALRTTREESHRDTGQHTTVGNTGRTLLSITLERLANAFPTSEWMKRRAERFSSEHAANPQSWPPPAAIDWLVADLGPIRMEGLPQIEVPRYAHLPDDYR